MSLTDTGSRQAPTKRTKLFIPPPACSLPPGAPTDRPGKGAGGTADPQDHKAEFRKMTSNWKDNSLAVPGTSLDTHHSFSPFHTDLNFLQSLKNGCITQQDATMFCKKAFLFPTQDEKMQTVNSPCIHLWETVTLLITRPC